MTKIFKFIGMIITAVMLFIVYVDMSDGGKPAVPYEARKGIDDNWPEKREAFYDSFCNENPTRHFCKLRGNK